MSFTDAGIAVGIRAPARLDTNEELNGLVYTTKCKTLRVVVDRHKSVRVPDVRLSRPET